MTPTLRARLRTAEQAVAEIRDGQTIATGGFVGAGVPEALLRALEERFLADGAPRGLTVVYAAGQGDGKSRGINHLAHEGLVARVIGGHWGLAPRMGRLALSGRIEAYNFPQGVICQLLRDIAAGRPGCITHVGLGTFIDPLHQGGRLNDRTPPGLVERVELGGRTWLWYKSLPIDVGLVRATAADPLGNLVMDEEGLFGEMLPIAQAAHNRGGLVIAQVKRLLDAPAPPQLARVPGVLVDRIVVAEEHEHHQTFADEAFNPAFVTAAKSNDHIDHTLLPTLPPGPRRIIASRACDELTDGDIANLGIGMPEGIASIAAERGLLDRVTLTVESGPIGGLPAGGLNFGVAVHPRAIVDQPSQFDFYDGGGLDFAALGLAQVDARGNVNVSRFGERLAGVGGFVNITQSARKVVFCGAFTTGGLEAVVERGKLRLLREGTVRKFLDAVEQVSFSAEHSRELGQQVVYITERAVFRPNGAGIELIEVAPGVDLQRDILDLLPFRPVVKDPRPMPRAAFE